MAFQIEEMQRVKEKYPQYKDMEDVTLLNSIVRKYPVYKPLALEVGDRIRQERAAQAEQIKKDRQGYISSRKPTIRDKIVEWNEKLGVGNTYDSPAKNLIAEETIGAMLMRRPFGAVKALVSGKDPKEGLLRPDEQQSFGESAVSAWGLNLNNPAHLGAAALVDGLSTYGTMHLLFGALKLPSKGVDKVKASYSKAQGKEITELKRVLNKELVDAGIHPAVAAQEVDIHVAQQWATNGMFRRTPGAIRKTTEIFKANEGKLAQAIQQAKNTASNTAQQYGHTPESLKQLVGPVPKPQPSALDAALGQAKQAKKALKKASAVSSKVENAVEPVVATTETAPKPTQDMVTKQDTGLEKRPVEPPTSSVQTEPGQKQTDMVKQKSTPESRAAAKAKFEAKQKAVESAGDEPLTTPALTPREIQKAKFREEILKRRAQKPKTTKPQDQVSTEADDLVEVTVRVRGVESTKKMTPKQLFDMKESIRNSEADIQIVDKAQKQAEAKATKLEKEADELLKKRTVKDQIDDIGEFLKGIKSKGLGSNLGNLELTPQAKAALKRLVKDAKDSGKELAKYLVEDLKLDAQNVAIIMKSHEAMNVKVQKIKLEAKQNTTKGTLDTKPVEESDAIIQEKLLNAKSEKHRKAIMAKYGVKSETVAHNPDVVKDTPELDPLMKESTLFNPKDKASVKINNAINRNLDNKKLRAQKLAAEKGKPTFSSNPWIDTSYQWQQIQEKTGMPMYTKYYVNGVELSNVMNKKVADVVNSFTSGLKKGYHTPESDARIVKWVTKRQGTLNAEEQATADKLIEVFGGERKDMIKYLRMRRWIDGIGKPPKGKGKLVSQARKVLKNDGVKALEEWVKDKDFGVIGGDRYLPAEILRGFNLEGSNDAFSVFNPHTMPRTAGTQKYDTTKPLAQKVHNYMARVYGDYYFYDYLKGLQGELKAFDVPIKEFNGIKAWVNQLQGHGIPTGPAGDFLRAARGQFFKTILFDAYKWARNLLQTPTFLYQNYPLSTNLVKTARLATQKLTPEQVNYFYTHVSQLGELRREYLYLYDKFFKQGMLGKADEVATKLAELYTMTDDFNRWWTFKHALAGLERDISLYKSGKLDYNTFAKRAGIQSYTDLELKHILAQEPDKAALEISRLMTEKTQVRYKKHERGTGALSELGEVGTSLMQFPRTVISRFLDGARMMVKGRTHHERWAGAQLILGYAIMGELSNMALQKIAGIKKYYDPDLKREVEYQPYSLLNAITGISFGGAQAGQIELVVKSNKLIVELISEEVKRRALGKPYTPKDKRRQLTIIREILKNADRLGESFIPFLKVGLNAVESFTDKQNYKLLTTTFDEITNRTSATRRNKVERTLMEKISHAIFDTERKGEDNEGFYISK